MKLAFITNFINHHQICLADEFYHLLNDNYTFIVTQPITEERIQLGYPIYERSYLIKSYENNQQYDKACQLATEADVVIIGCAPESFVSERIDKGKLTFRYDERWFKNRPWFSSGPRAWINYYKYHIRHKNKPLYMLAASAYTCRDVYDIGAYKNKVFKWGYFTRVDDFALETLSKLDVSSVRSTPHIMWCARFLRWKHPELPIKLARRLKDKGYNFHLDMYGSGVELDNTKNLATKLGVNDVVSFCGNLPNDEILKEMCKHEIFLFTSDRNEGWGAVLNESMSNGCAVVASNLIGSVPFLIEDGVNGLIFKSENLNSLECKVIDLLENPSKRIEMAKQAIHTMREVWSPSNAAKNFLNLVDAINSNNESLIPSFGPGSKAERL